MAALPHLLHAPLSSPGSSDPSTRGVRLRPGAGSGAGDVLQLFRDGHLRTRAELVRETGLSRSTVRAKVDALIAAGYLIEPEAETTGGRPAGRIGQNPRHGLVLAIDLGASHVSVAVLDLERRVLAEESSELDIADGPVPVLDRAAAMGRRLLAQASEGLPLLGVGVGVPGPVAHSSGQPVRPPIMPGWDGFDIPAELGPRFGAPVLVDNDVNLMALGEHVQHWPQGRHLLFVKVSTGIGSGIITEGRLTRGAIGTAGDLGHVGPTGSARDHLPLWNVGCLEAVAGGRALVSVINRTHPGITSMRDLVTAVNAANTDAIGLVREAGRAIGQVLATCVSLLNPSVIAIGGILSEAGEPLLAGVRESIYQRSIPLATAELRIGPAHTGSRAGVLGAAAMVIDQALSPATVDAALAAMPS